MNRRHIILALVLTGAGLLPPSASTAKTVSVAGAVSQSCRLGGSNNFTLSIVVTGSGSNRSAVITFDGASSPAENNPNKTTSATKNYSFVCNGGTIAVNAPLTNLISGNRYTYSVDIKKGATSVLAAPVSSGNSASFTSVPTTGDSTYSVIATINGPINSFPIGTYSATVTIQ